jgi:hypothetical protein
MIAGLWAKILNLRLPNHMCYTFNKLFCHLCCNDDNHNDNNDDGSDGGNYDDDER